MSEPQAAPSQLDLVAIRALANRLGSSRAPVRDAAAAELAAMGPDALDEACHHLIHNRNPLGWLALLCLLVCAALCALSPLFTSRGPAGVVLSFLVGGSYGTFYASWMCDLARQKRAWDALSRAAAGGDRPGGLRSLVCCALRRRRCEIVAAALVAALGEADRHSVARLGSDDLKRMRELMITSRNVAIAQALLRFFERYGDWRDVASVRDLCEQGKLLYAPASKHRSVNEVAKQAEVAIRSRAAETVLADKLVRPAPSSGDPTSTLVRAAHGVADLDQERLPRPVGAGTPLALETSTSPGDSPGR